MLGGVAPRTKPVAGSPFLLDYPNIIRDNGQRKNTFLGICRGSEGVLSLIYPMLIPYASFGQVPMRFQSGSDEVPMEIRGK